jgi:hypothetical protein
VVRLLGSLIAQGWYDQGVRLLDVSAPRDQAGRLAPARAVARATTLSRTFRFACPLAPV